MICFSASKVTGDLSSVCCKALYRSGFAVVACWRYTLVVAVVAKTWKYNSGLTYTIMLNHYFTLYYDYNSGIIHQHPINADKMYACMPSYRRKNESTEKIYFHLKGKLVLRWLETYFKIHKKTSTQEKYNSSSINLHANISSLKFSELARRIPKTHLLRICQHARTKCRVSVVLQWKLKRYASVACSPQG